MGTERTRLVELTSQPVPSSLSDGDEPTETRIPAQRIRNGHAERILQARLNGTFSVSIDEKGFVKLFVAGQGATVLKPEEAFELLDLLFEYRNLLASLSAQAAEQQYEKQKEYE